MIRFVEITVFLAIAVAVHLLWFFVQSPVNSAAGGSGGASSVTLTSAGPELAELVEAWDDSPYEAEAPDVIEEIEPLEAPEVEVETDIIARVEPVKLPVAAEIADAPTLEEIPTPTAGIETPAALEALNPPPEEAPKLETPLDALVEIARPAVTAPKVSARAPSFEVVEVEPPVTKDSPAPRAAPAPRAKPKPPAEPVQIAKSKAEPRQEAKRQPAAQPQPIEEPIEQAETQAQGGDDGQASTSSLAAGSGLTVEAGAVVTSAGSGADLSGLTRSWADRIRRKIERKKPRNNRRSGTVRVAMTIDRAGGLVSANIKQSSGSDRLDRAAMKAVRAAAPYPAMPHELKRKSYLFVVPLRFAR